MVQRLVVLVPVLALVLAGSGWASSCYEVDGESSSMPAYTQTLTCDTEYIPCNRYLELPRWVYLDCAGHAEWQYPGAFNCVVDELSPCFYDESLEASDFQVLEAVDEVVDLSYWATARFKVVLQHKRTRGVVATQMHYRGMPMFGGSGFCVTDECQSYSGIRWNWEMDPLNNITLQDCN
ncbi:MAG TPA: hypothetical protein PLD23_11305 [Armatimonadota bacterium]|nr:hypothetical protein [Armatimonadota bacterium]HQK94086.1 hypothetical protein [Armatimonadota bacterium]